MVHQVQQLEDILQVVVEETKKLVLIQPEQAELAVVELVIVVVEVE
tara:strand:+ start:284 stop:421 length:138 start_codon:yes stop_codon:yes gene_type:complete